MRVETKITAEELKKLDYCCKASEKTWSEIIREDVDIVYVRLNKIK